MPFDPVPWFVGSGALHPAETARVLAYAATSGAAGVVAADDLRITELPTPGTSVRAASGAVIIPNLYPGGSQQSYIGRAASVTDIPVTATDAASGRVDLVVARTDDPWYGGTVPDDVTIGPYIRIAIIENVVAGSTDLPAGLAYPAIVLARLDIPASTGTILTSMITDLRKVAGDEEWEVYSPAWSQLDSSGLSIGNGSLAGRWAKDSLGRVIYTGLLTRGSTSNVGTTTYVWSIPTPPVSYLHVTGSGLVRHAGGEIPCVAVMLNSASLVLIGPGGRIGNDYPGEWVSGNTIQWTVTYEAAADS